MALEFPSPEQFAASQGNRPILVVVSGVVAVVVLSSLFACILQPTTAKRRLWSFAIIGLLLLIVPWQLRRLVNQLYERVADDWHSAVLSSPVPLLVAEQLLLQEEWIGQRQISAEIDRQQFVTALEGCTQSRRPAKWFRGLRVLVSLTDRSASQRELSLLVVLAAPDQLNAALPNACVTFTATPPGGPYHQEPKLELECPALAALIMPLLDGQER